MHQHHVLFIWFLLSRSRTSSLDPWAFCRISERHRPSIFPLFCSVEPKTRRRALFDDEGVFVGDKLMRLWARGRVKNSINIHNINPHLSFPNDHPTEKEKTHTVPSPRNLPKRTTTLPKRLH
ncbi:hypothetical protein B0J11DRAFT_251400 [Dendryphion nanum]|uniref:Secreted protein n=1 Tax=Dendryphion nanum TaxID=256645 RepID=A0A9P9ITI3_9PLEO|nr:hypothetical protein B0J11DRAFT_251400 [Dendryphion nanum]